MHVMSTPKYCLIFVKVSGIKILIVLNYVFLVQKLENVQKTLLLSLG
jgi:hypothetical protein